MIRFHAAKAPLRCARTVTAMLLLIGLLYPVVAQAESDDDLAPPRLIPISVMLDWYVNPVHAPLIVAKQRGLFEQRGLDVDIQSPADPSVPPKLVAAGRIDLALSYQPQLHLQVDQGLPVTRIGTLVATPLNALVVRADSGIESLSQLAGKKVGYSVGGVEETLLSTMLAHNGLNLDDVEMVNVNFSLTPALISEQVDAVTGAFRNFELAQMKLEGVEGKAFYIEEEGVPTYDELIFVANRDTLDAHRDAYRRFLDAVGEATAWIINHPDEAWQRFTAYDPSLDTPLNEAAWDATLPRFALRPSALDAGRYRDFEAFLLEQGQISAQSPVSRLAVDLDAP
ncbi:ABC transporter substrate-binding protein [Salinicola avicenniae]|uniref:ABC transporter substrate-binding protein n=1 Tax=Salinicola avicenniae TaxID=2916836 RepID=UPI0020743B35|nr:MULTISPECIES: ABC transporter substrate-binding protein [unclassified Salinicola]